jgi:hypothetical protein
MKLSQLFTFAAVTLCAGFATAHALEFRVLVWEGSESALKYTANGKTINISGTENDLSPVYRFTGAGPLVLFKEVQQEGKTIRETAATLPLPIGVTHAILILAPADASQKSYLGMWINDAPDSRPAETIQFVNLSSYPTTFKFGDQDFSIAPGANHQVRFDAALERIVLRGAAYVGDKWELFSGNPVPVRAGLRLLMVLRNGRPAPGRSTAVVDMVSFYDRPPAIPGAPATANP